MAREVGSIDTQLLYNFAHWGVLCVVPGLGPYSLAPLSLLSDYLPSRVILGFPAANRRGTGEAQGGAGPWRERANLREAAGGKAGGDSLSCPLTLQKKVR